MTRRIFISYRREDSAAWAGRIHDHLSSHFGDDMIFMDVSAIPSGVDFVDVFSNAVQECDVLVALIGRQWLSIKDNKNRRRLDNPEDFVRIEVSLALQRGIRVIPVVVEGATMLRESDLPENLKPLARRNALRVEHERFNTDIMRLISSLEQALKSAEQKRIAQKKANRERLAKGNAKASQKAKNDLKTKPQKQIFTKFVENINRLWAVYLNILFVGVLVALPFYYFFGPELVLNSSNPEIIWEQIGPKGNSILALIPHPKNPLTLYAIVDAQGVYFSEDGGETWHSRNQGIEDVLVLSLVIADSDGETLYIGTSLSGVFKSEDAGITWQALDFSESELLLDIDGTKRKLSNLFYVRRIVTDNNGNVYAVAGDNGIFFSIDGGDHWASMNGNLPLPIDVQTLLFNPIDENIILIGTGRGIFQSKDRGKTWEQKSTDSVSWLCLDNQGDTVFAGGRKGLFLSNDGGDTWDLVNKTEPESLYHISMMLSINDNMYVGGGGGIYKILDNHIFEDINGNLKRDGLVIRDIVQIDNFLYVGTGIGIYRSGDGGSTWQELNNGFPENGLIAKDILFSADGTTLYTITWGGGLFSSTDRGMNWASMNQGILEGYGISLELLDSKLFAATWDGIFTLTEGNYWENSIYEDIRGIAASGLSGNIIYAIAAPSDGWEQTADGNWKRVNVLLKSNDSGGNWQEIKETYNYNLSDVIVNQNNPEEVLIATWDNGVLKSLDGGKSWDQYNNGLSSSAVHHLFWGGDNHEILFAGTTIGLYRKKLNMDWEKMILGSYNPIFTDPQEGNRVYVASDNAILLSQDYGESWQNISHIDVNLNKVVFDPQDNRFMYAASEGNSVLRGDLRALYPRNIKKSVVLITGIILFFGESILIVYIRSKGSSKNFSRGKLELQEKVER